MTNQDLPYGTFSQADIDAALRRAHIARAKAMRKMLVGLVTLVKRGIASLHVHHGHALSHAKVGA